jgi:hypothetical protein
VAKLPTINCLRCGKELGSKEFNPTSKGGAPYASSYKTCLRKCEECGLGFSNASSNCVNDLTVIYRDPFWNVPASIAEGYEFTLKHAINVVNRRSKRVKFTSSKSEDHVTWTVFRCLQTQGRVRDAISKVGIEFAHFAIGEPTLLLWGVPVPKEDRLGKGVRTKLENALDGIGEEPNRRSEPDVILDLGTAGLVFIEVKLWSKNDTKEHDYEGWGKYLTSSEFFLDFEKLRHSGLYELARNWRIACEMANGRPVALVNLGPADLFKNDRKGRLPDFLESLRQSPARRFLKLTWTSFLEAIPNKPEWFNQYIQDRGLINL